MTYRTKNWLRFAILAAIWVVCGLGIYVAASAVAALVVLTTGRGSAAGIDFFSFAAPIFFSIIFGIEFLNWLDRHIAPRLGIERHHFSTQGTKKP